MRNWLIPAIVCLLALVMGCAEEQGTGVIPAQDSGNVPFTPSNNNNNPGTNLPSNTPSGPQDGSEGGACFANGTCTGDLECVNNICTKKADGALGGACYANGTCNEGLVCVDGTCKEPASQPQGDAGGECYPNGTCNAPNECKEGVCVPPQCLETACTTDIECALCKDDKLTCLVEENRCVACNPNTNEGCEYWQQCTSNGVCEEVAAPCPTTEDGTPTISCTKNSDCAGCSPAHKVCDLEDNRCKACTETNTQNCLKTDICVDGACSQKCPAECSVDGDCAQCEVKGIEAKACFAQMCGVLRHVPVSSRRRVYQWSLRSSLRVGRSSCGNLQHRRRLCVLRWK